MKWSYINEANYSLIGGIESRSPKAHEHEITNRMTPDHENRLTSLNAKMFTKNETTRTIIKNADFAYFWPLFLFLKSNKSM